MYRWTGPKTFPGVFDQRHRKEEGTWNLLSSGIAAATFVGVCFVIVESQQTLDITISHGLYLLLSLVGYIGWQLDASHQRLIGGVASIRSAALYLSTEVVTLCFALMLPNWVGLRCACSTSGNVSYAARADGGYIQQCLRRPLCVCLQTWRLPHKWDSLSSDRQAGTKAGELDWAKRQLPHYAVIR